MKKLSLKSLLFSSLFIASQLFAQDPVLSEIMFNPSGDGNKNEFVELYNPTNQTIDLSNFSIKVATFSVKSIIALEEGTLLAPESFAVILEGDYDADTGPYSFPDDALVVTINSTTFGPMANSSGRPVHLLNSGGDTLSVYTYSANNSAGYSDEKILMSGNNNSDNWANTLVFNGTPGFKNSVSPRENDLSVEEISILPSPPIADQDLSALVKVLNLGTDNAASFEISLYSDENFDSTAQVGELIDSFTLNNLASGDSVSQSFNLGTMDEGDYQLIAIVDLPDDEAGFNDTLYYNFTVLPPPPPFNAIVINEIMYDPPSGEPEWVEIFNRSDQSYSLVGWQIADAVGSSVITNEDIIIAPDEYVILAADASVSDFYDIDSEIIVMNLPVLNNGGDDVVLMESNSFVIDSLTYSSSWGGSNDNSLERIEPDLPSDNSENWGSSISPDGATPGKINSLSPKNFDLIVNEINLSPTPPVEGDNLTASVLVKNIGENQANTFTVELYNDENFDSTPQVGELINSFSLSNLASSDSVSQNFNLGSFPAGNLQLIAVVDFNEDEDLTNNQLVEEFNINEPPPPFNAIVVNEIMYAPSTGEPEWVEIYNQSNESYNLQNWQFADAANTVLITTESITILPGEYIVLSANSSVSDFYDIDSEIIVFNLPALNNGGDEVILMDDNSFIIDSLTYTSSWGGSSGGRSLERILFEEQSHEPSNWGTSVSPAKATPGKINSISPKDFDLQLSEISITPAPPIENTDLTAKVLIHNLGSNQANSFTVELYNDENFDSNPQPGELINSFNLSNLASGDSLTQNFNLGSFSEGNVQLIGIVIFSQDEDNTNNELIYEFTIFPPPPDFNDIVINEIMYAPSEVESEWVEIYNRSTQVYDLINWQFADAANTALITTNSITIDPGGFIVLAKDASVEDFYDLDATVIVFNLPALNNGGDQAILMDGNSFIIDSLTYLSSWGGTNGRSLERINVDYPSSDADNWGTSVSPNNATPGKINSLTPKDYDLAISEIAISPSPPIQGTDLSATVTTANIGNNQAGSFVIELYNDENFDSTPQSGELINSFELTTLASGDSVSQEFELGSFTTGDLQLIAVVEFNQDEDNTNNQLVEEFIINEPPPPFNSIVINEIMYAPSSGEPEWVEIYNRSDQTYNLANWQFADAANTSLITTESVTISPGEYLVLAKDESIRDFYDFNATLIVFNLPALNNGGDRTVLLDPNSFEIDSLTYTSSWGGTGGRSLERINFDAPSSDSNNWGTSVSPNKATPGSVNSLASKDYDLFLSEININPSPPIENQELSAVVNVINTGLNSAPSYTVALYNDQNFNSAPDAGELVDSFTRTNLASGDSVSVTFELGSFPVGNVQLIGVVNFEGDEDLSNNELITEFSIFPPPPDYNDIVINEIMYAPQDQDPGEAVVKKRMDKVTAAEPEWIEIYNRSESTYLLSGWRIADAAGSALITTLPIRIEPNEFVVLADDSSFFNFYSSESKVIVMNLPALNNGGDQVKILNENSFLVDSLEYTSAWGGANGKSLERIDPSEPSTSQNNWGESISPNGATPGTENSIVPREFDLAVTYFDSETDFLFIEEPSTFEVRVLNLGSSELINASLQIYYDQNGDLIFTENEIIGEFTNLDFEANELIEKTLNYTFASAGEVNLLAVINHLEDSFAPNDSLQLTKSVIEPNVNRGDIVVNEFMFAPSAPYPEWIELYNNTDVPRQLRNFRIADASSSTELSSQNILIPAQSFLVIARDSIITQLYDIPSQVLIRPLPALNNSGDKIILFDNFGRVIDSLEYTSDWGGGDGNSLEKINSFGNSSDPNNWTTSTDPSNGTPGKPNSILPKDYDVTLTEFYSEPSSPTSGDEISFFAEVLNSGINEATFSVKLFESNSEVDKINQLDEVGVENLAPGAEQTINFNYKIDSFEGDQFFIALADFELDQDTSDNSQLILIAPATPPKALVINEIMFVPAEDEPEWIELYNRSDVTINLKDWIVSDVLSRPATAVISFENLYVEPDQFIVLAKDSNIFEYHPGLPSEKVVLVPFANLNNTTDGVVIYDRLGSTIDSVFYSNQFERKSGYSIERLSIEGSSNDPDNWAVSNSPQKGTPGFINSRVPKNYDLEVTTLLIDPEFPELGQNIKVAAEVKNIGLQSVNNFTLVLSSEELSFNQEFTIEGLDTNESEVIFSDETFKMPESFSLTAEVTFAQDENLSNNSMTETFYSGYPPLSMLVNEVMYSPSAGGSEWIEFVNNSSESINLNQWKVVERSKLGDPVAITDNDIIIEPNEYFVVAADTSTGEFRGLDVKLFEANFGTLNSTEDDVVIFDFRNAIIDSLNYSSSWGGGGGVSIERISLSAPTNERTNWLPSMSISGASLGTANSTSGIIQASKNQVVVNEIMYEPETDNSEFVEFYNASDQFVEIANWTVEDDSKNSSIISRTSMSIPPESYFVVAADSSILLNYPELKDFERLIIVNHNMSLNNSEDLVYLTNAFGATVDSVFYSSGWHNKRTTSTRNKSLERINPFLDGNDPNNWSTSVSPEGSTPGKANSIFIENKESGNAISLTPNPFSPDGDGFEDFAIINYKLPREAVSIHIQVFDSKGRKVRSISEENLFTDKGSIIFDGFNDSGQPLKIGIYILLIEAFDSGGSTHTFKEVVVVARRL